MTESAQNVLEGFRIQEVKFREENKHAHQVFFKPHNVRVLEPSKPTDRTLFCANIPPWMTEEALKRMFQAGVYILIIKCF